MNTKQLWTVANQCARTTFHFCEHAFHKYIWLEVTCTQYETIDAISLGCRVRDRVNMA